jgi:uncharacterized membrane protein
MAEPGPSLRSGIAQAVAADFSFESAVGGVRGLVESVVPTVVFTLVYALTKDLRACVLAALGTALLATVVRLVQRQSVMQAVSGLLGVGIAAAIAWYTGAAINFFLASIVKNAFFAVLCLVSIVARWPYVGVVLGFMLGEGTHWRQVPARARVYALATWVWVAMFLVRLGFQVPLYLQGRVTGLGAASVPLGLPLFGVVTLACWLIVRRVPVARPPADDTSDEVPDEAPDEAP